MAMSDCEKCWDTPCSCGYDYRWMSVDKRLQLASVILGVSKDELKIATLLIVPEKHPKQET